MNNTFGSVVEKNGMSVVLISDFRKRNFYSFDEVILTSVPFSARISLKALCNYRFQETPVLLSRFQIFYNVLQLANCSRIFVRRITRVSQNEHGLFVYSNIRLKWHGCAYHVSILSSSVSIRKIYVCCNFSTHFFHRFWSTDSRSRSTWTFIAVVDDHYVSRTTNRSKMCALVVVYRILILFFVKAKMFRLHFLPI